MRKMLKLPLDINRSKILMESKCNMKDHQGKLQNKQ